MPSSSANFLSVCLESHEMLRTCASRSSNPASPSLRAHTSPVQVPVKANGKNITRTLRPRKSLSEMVSPVDAGRVKSGAGWPTTSDMGTPRGTVNQYEATVVQHPGAAIRLAPLRIAAPSECRSSPGPR